MFAGGKTTRSKKEMPKKHQDLCSMSNRFFIYQKIFRSKVFSDFSRTYAKGGFGTVCERTELDFPFMLLLSKDVMVHKNMAKSPCVEKGSKTKAVVLLSSGISRVRMCLHKHAGEYFN
jgi:hypothetical protein